MSTTTCVTRFHSVSTGNFSLSLSRSQNRTGARPSQNNQNALRSTGLSCCSSFFSANPTSQASVTTVVVTLGVCIENENDTNPMRSSAMPPRLPAKLLLTEPELTAGHSHPRLFLLLSNSCVLPPLPILLSLLSCFLLVTWTATAAVSATYKRSVSSTNFLLFLLVVVVVIVGEGGEGGGVLTSGIRRNGRGYVLT